MEPKQLIEANRRLKAALVDRSVKTASESTKESFGVDLSDKAKFDFASPLYDWKGFRESAYRLAKRTFQEANAEGVFSALLRAGINNIANSWYKLVETNHEQICGMAASSHAVEPYPVVNRGGIPRHVPRGTTFPEVKVGGPVDIQIQNEKFGAITALEAELFADDQSGVIQSRVQDIGPNMAILEDAWAFQRFIGTAGSINGDVIPASEMSTIWSAALTGGGANRPGAYVAFTSGNLQAADIALMNQLDSLGNKLLVMPNTLLVGTSNKFTASTLLNSQWYPSNVTAKVGGVSTGADTAVGAAYAENVMKGLYSLVVSRFFPAKAWALGEAGKGLIFQMREGLSVVQENPASGVAFSADEYRFRAKARWNVDWIDPRFWYLGNDGSV